MSYTAINIYCDTNNEIIGMSAQNIVNHEFITIGYNHAIELKRLTTECRQLDQQRKEIIDKLTLLAEYFKYPIYKDVNNELHEAKRNEYRTYKNNLKDVNSKIKTTKEEFDKVYKITGFYKDVITNDLKSKHFDVQ